MKNSIIIVDYGAGNLKSIENAFQYLGYKPFITNNPKDILLGDAIVFPGQGSSPKAMSALVQLDIVGALKTVIQKGTPFLGICLGLQTLMSRSEEGDTPCLDIIPGVTRLLPNSVKVPHMGWNQVDLSHSHPAFKDIPPASYFYFVHSYYADPQDQQTIIGTTNYGLSFCSVLATGNILATQFHPEKSGPLGLTIYDNFMKGIG